MAGQGKRPRPKGRNHRPMRIHVIYTSGINARIHAAGCPDIEPERTILRVTGEYETDAATQHDAAEEFWAEAIAEGSMTPAEAMDCTTVMPCAAGLPAGIGGEAVCFHCGAPIHRERSGQWGAGERSKIRPWYCPTSTEKDKNHQPRREAVLCIHCATPIRRNVSGIWEAGERPGQHPGYCPKSPLPNKDHEPGGEVVIAHCIDRMTRDSIDAARLLRMTDTLPRKIGRTGEVIGYIRLGRKAEWSTEPVAEQKRRISEAAKRNGWVITDWVADSELSGPRETGGAQ